MSASCETKEEVPDKEKKEKKIEPILLRHLSTHDPLVAKWGLWKRLPPADLSLLGSIKRAEPEVNATPTHCYVRLFGLLSTGLPWEHTFPLADAEEGGGLIIGGSDELSHIVLIDEGVSRAHACFTVKNGVLVISDLNSTNGTMVEGEALSPSTPACALDDGMVINLGQMALRVEIVY